MDLPPIPTRIVLAPMAGGPGTPALAAAVSDAGGLGFLAAGYLTPARLRADLASYAALSPRPCGVNLFVPAGPDEARLTRAREYVAGLADWASARGETLPAPVYTDDAYAEKVALLEESPPAVVSFVFGLPDADTVARLRGAGTAVLVTVNQPDEAREALDLGVDGLVAQGWEAGAHRGGWREPDPMLALLPLLEAVLPLTDLPVVAAGGLATGRGVAAVLAAGAHSAMLGTAFLRTPEAGTVPAQRAALASPAATVLTRGFTGKWARAVGNAFTREVGTSAPEGYPEINGATSAVRARARAAGDADGFHLWGGQGHALARAEPAADVVRRLATEAAELLGTSLG